MSRSGNKRNRTLSENAQRERPTQRATHQVEFSNAFEKSLKSLGRTAEGTIAAEATTFVSEWKRCVSDADLRSAWHYGPVKGGEAHNVKHIYVCRQYRIDFTVIPTQPPTLYFLNVYRRTTQIAQDVKDSIKRAKAVWRECAS